MTHLVNDIKSKSGTDQLYIRIDDVEAAIRDESDPDKKAIFQWVHDHFRLIDKAKDGNNIWQTNDRDGLIGAGDIEKYFGWTK
ncbi:hypothetical protein RY831_22480 [Noviherbaspirillum sp. CPCC 100848]|uniref:Uncharacterized protein n=1 Tax=Noviherbaspirillum album TaxID=3080276 RepID=A0ABU6JE59_9BURK|nr:hypothetical protein [Noviherbaspirillum sp. CPCC 100848]MEC4721940.1 hypothetical protein [Noviherbaspirillum sp. CPCC 100848]